MPCYTWLCQKCQHIEDVVRSFDEYTLPPDPLTEVSKDCPDGDAHQWERMIGGSQAVLKGPGWGYGRKGHW